MITANPQPEALLRWMGSLAETTRLRLLRLLEQHELGVSDLCDVVQMPQSTVSRHLKLLSDEGWLVSRRQGTTNRYRMVLDELAPAQRKLWLLAREQSGNWPATEQDQLRLAERLRRKRDDSQAFFEGAAGEWDRLRSELYGTAFSRDALLALVPGDWVVADLGCGTGSITADLARFVGQVIGVDNSPAMLDAARQRTAGQDNVDLRQGDVEAVPIDDNVCDAVMQVLVLTYVPEPRRVVQEMHRILKPGGTVVVVDLLKHDREDFRRQMGQQSLGFEPAGLCELLQEAGFDRASCWSIPPEEKARGPALLVGRARKM
ncbi:MAG: metalloregulator ArsR/SmtB family transcription factor [Phycisphaeraceae bacterium]